MKTSGENFGAIQTFIDQGGFATRVSTPCVIEDFIQVEGQEPYVNVRLSLKRRKYTRGRSVEFIETEIIEEVPILYPSTAEFAITIPIKKGDRGWLIHADGDLHQWDISGDEIAETDTSRFHNLTDCIFIPGGWPRPNPLNGYSDEWAEIRDLESSTRVALKKGNVHLQARLWHLVLSELGFDVYGSQSLSLMETLIQALESSAAGFTALSTETVLTQKQTYAATAATLLKSTLALTAIKGESDPPNRSPQPVARP